MSIANERLRFKLICTREKDFFIVHIMFQQVSLRSTNSALLTMPITRVHARSIYDSRGNPTVEVDLTTEKGIVCRFFFNYFTTTVLFFNSKK